MTARTPIERGAEARMSLERLIRNDIAGQIWRAEQEIHDVHRAAGRFVYDQNALGQLTGLQRARDIASGDNRDFEEQSLEPQEVMSEYVPTTGSIQDAYCHVQQEVLDERGDSAHERFHAEFDRWLTAHEARIAREAAEKAWDEGFVECADMWSQQEGGTGPEPDSNPYRAEREGALGVER